MDNSNASLEATKHSLTKGAPKQSGSKAKTSNVPESPQETSESEASDDARVCDICGDEGLEELLAVCTRCNDGAEHTYCMQKKLKELPEGDWLCEECKFKEETENQNADKSETVPGALAVPQSTKANQNTKSCSDAKCLAELDSKALNSVEKGSIKRPPSPKISVKREEPRLEVDLKTSKKVLESNDVSTRTADGKNKSVLHEGSLCNLGADKTKQGNLLENHGQTVSNSLFSRSHTFAVSNSSKTLDSFQSSRGPLSKSVSFNNSHLKPKVQFIGSIPPNKQNMVRESNDTRKGRVKKMSESASFKGIRAGHSNGESITKSQPLHSLQAEDHRVQKEINTVEKKNAMLERLLVNPAAGAAVGNLHSEMGPEGRIASELKALDVNRESRDKDSLGCLEGKLPCTTKGFGRSSSILTAQKPCQPVVSEVIHEVSSATDRSCGILSVPSQRSTSQVVEFSHGNDRSKDALLPGIPKQAVGGILRCRKCNETGHPTQFCSIDKLAVSALKPLADRSARDWHNKSNKTKDAADPPILKPALQKDSRLQYHSEKASTPSANFSYEVPSKEIQSSSSSCLRNSTNMERTCGEDVVRSSIVDHNKRAASVNVNLQAAQVEASCVSRENNLNPILTFSDLLNTRQCFLPNTASVPEDMLRSSVIPQLEFIWQGGFEVLQSGRLSKSCEGIQAHLSTYSSPKVFEAATKIPCKVQLEEVTYLSSWPFRYQGHTPGEHNIALFFFAKDIESYEKNYSKLLDDMIKNDLALKGNIAGAELLIFPSNKLPQNSQRWNRLFFLWGVFIEKRFNCSEALPEFEDKPSKVSLNLEQPVQDLPIPIAEAYISQELSNENKKMSESKDAKHATFENLRSTSPGLQMALSCSRVENEVTRQNNFDLEGTKDLPLHDKEKIMETASLFKRDAFWGDDSSESIDFRSNTKRSLQTAIRTISHAPGRPSQSSDAPIQWNEKLDFPPTDDRREYKKMKPENRGHIDCNLLDENFSSTSSSNVEARMEESSRAHESSLFSLKLDPLSDMTHNKVTRPSYGEGPTDIPNLELALGAKKKLPEEEFLSSPSPNSMEDISASLSLSLSFHSSVKKP